MGQYVSKFVLVDDEQQPTLSLGTSVRQPSEPREGTNVVVREEERPFFKVVKKPMEGFRP